VPGVTKASFSCRPPEIPVHCWSGLRGRLSSQELDALYCECNSDVATVPIASPPWYSPGSLRPWEKPVREGKWMKSRRDSFAEGVIAFPGTNYFEKTDGIRSLCSGRISISDENALLSSEGARL
jgi:hypothetical protein